MLSMMKRMIDVLIVVELDKIEFHTFSLYNYPKAYVRTT